MGLLSRIRSKLTPPSYNSDGMKLYSRTLDFRSDPRFIAAYRRGMNSGHVIQRSAGSTKDIGIDYRAYMECWAAQHGLHLKGDFVWCGVNTGIYSLAACDYTDINSSEKSIWLFDTYEGIPADQISPAERAKHREVENVMYPECYQLAKKNFADFRNAKLVRGKVPDSLSTVSIDHVAYLSIDM